jgi:hypothetical protein
MRILLWQVHGGWLDAFVRGPHTYLLATERDGSGGRGNRDWPPNALDVALGDIRNADVDLVVLQRMEEFDAVERLLGRRPGHGVPTIFVEHNTPRENVPESLHPLRDRDDILIAHVTHFNALFWETGRTPTVVVEHGVVDYGSFYTGEAQRMAAAINEPIRRWRITGTDLLGRFSQLAPVDVFGMKTGGLADALHVPSDRVVSAGDLATPRLWEEIGQRRLYLHPNRWTSLGLSLLEAMHAGLPVVALDTTDIRRAVPPEAGVVSTDIEELRTGAAGFLSDRERAMNAGTHARAFALARFGLVAFIERWNTVMEDWLCDRRL